MRVEKRYRPDLATVSKGAQLSALCSGAARVFDGIPTAIEVHPDCENELRAELLKYGPIPDHVFVVTPLGRVPIITTWPAADEISIVRMDGWRSWRFVLSFSLPLEESKR